MVWAGISTNTAKPTCVVPGNFNGRHYIDGILRHMSYRNVERCFPGRQCNISSCSDRRQNRVAIMYWPPIIPDLTCIDHLLGMFGWVIYKRITQQTRQDLLRMYHPRMTGGLITQQQIRKLVFSMRRRQTECTRVIWKVRSMTS